MFTIRKKAFVGVALAAAMFVGWTVPASAQTEGIANFDGFLVVSAESGTREILKTEITVTGAFEGVGTIVETENQPGDQENEVRDDLVFEQGTMHLLSRNLNISFDVDPQSCVGTFHAEQANTVQGGTGLFANASGTGTGTVTGYGLLPRTPDGSCDEEQETIFEVDLVSGAMALSY